MICFWKLIKFTDELNYVTIFFQHEINVGTGHVKSTDLVIVKYLHLIGCLYIAIYFHTMLPIFSSYLQIAVLTYLQATFSVDLGLF